MTTVSEGLWVEDLILADDLRAWADVGGPSGARVAAQVLARCKTHGEATRVRAEALAVIVEQSLAS